MTMPEFATSVIWECDGCDHMVGENAWIHDPMETECPRCGQKRPKDLDPAYVLTVRDGIVVHVKKLDAANPVLDKPNGPGWYWYQHPPQEVFKCSKCGHEHSPNIAVGVCEKCSEFMQDKVMASVDPVIMEVGIQGTDFKVEWKGAIVSLDQLPGKWQRVASSSFHEEN